MSYKYQKSIPIFISEYGAIKFQEEVDDYFKPPLKQIAKDFLSVTKSTKSQSQSSLSIILPVANFKIQDLPYRNKIQGKTNDT